MYPFTSDLDVTVNEVAQKLNGVDHFILLDIREHDEFNYARISDDRVNHVPMSILAAKGIEAFPQNIQEKSSEIIVFCHHGIRSSQVVAWMQDMGWQKVYNMQGGINAYASYIDPTLGRY
jgi:adenylyltransferase/sulfurtransferase